MNNQQNELCVEQLNYLYVLRELLGKFSSLPIKIYHESLFSHYLEHTMPLEST